MIKIDTDNKGEYLYYEDEYSSYEEQALNLAKVLAQLVKDGKVEVRRDAITGQDTYMRIN